MKKIIIVGMFTVLVIISMVFSVGSYEKANAETPTTKFNFTNTTYDTMELVEFSCDNIIPIYEGTKTECIVSHYYSNDNGKTFEIINQGTPFYFEYIPTNTNNKMDMSGGVILEEISDNSMYYVTISYNVIDNNGSILEDGIITSNSIKLN